MFKTEQHPFVTLRKQIRQAGRQFRHNDDSSQSIFHPKKGFIYAYDLRTVEQALDAYERSLPQELQDDINRHSPESKIMQEANIITATHPSLDARNFAGQVLNYFMGLREQKDLEEAEPGETNPLRLLKPVQPIQEGMDSL